MKNKKNIKFIITILGIIILPLLIEFTRSNISVVFLPDSQFGRKAISEEKIEVNYDDEKGTCSIKSINSYIKKLTIDFKTEESSQIKLTTIAKNEYGIETKETIDGELISSIDSGTFNINKEVSEISISGFNSDTLIEGVTINNAITFNIYVYFILLSVLLILIYVYVNRHKIIQKLHLVFIMLSLTMGLVIVLTTPHLSYFSLDEQIHMDNSYNLSYIGDAYQSKAVQYANKSEDMTWPKTIEDNQLMDKYLNSDEISNRDVLITKSKLVEYNQIPYLIMSVAMGIGRILGATFTQIFTLGKLANLLFYTLVCGYALKRATCGKKLLFILMIMPTCLFISTHYTLDGIINSCFFLGFVLFFEMYRDKNKIRPIDLALFVTTVSIATLAKAIYAPIILLPLLINKERFANVKQARYFKLTLSVLFIVLISTFVLPMISGTMVSDARGGDTSVVRQLMNIINHPISFIQVFFWYIFNEVGYMFFSAFLYVNFGYAAQIVPYNFVAIYLVFLLFAIFLSAEELRIQNRKHRLAILIGSICLVCIVYGTMYLSFTPVGQTVINGVQARYFIPLLFPIIICIVPKIKVRINNKVKFNTIFITLSVAYIACVTFYLTSKFYL